LRQKLLAFPFATAWLSSKIFVGKKDLKSTFETCKFDNRLSFAYYLKQDFKVRTIHFSVEHLLIQ